MNKRESGSNYEQLACDYLKEHGAKIIRKNFRCKLGEIDIIARDGRYLCFIEVKYRTDLRFGGPEAAVNYDKQKKISKVSANYLKMTGMWEVPVRYDVLAIHGENRALTVNWIKNAFDYCA